MDHTRPWAYCLDAKSVLNWIAYAYEQPVAAIATRHYDTADYNSINSINSTQQQYSMIVVYLVAITILPDRHTLMPPMLPTAEQLRYT